MEKLIKVQKAINAATAKLIDKCSKHGLYENFGQKEVRQLEDKFIDLSDYSYEANQIRDIISAFDNWAANYTG